MTAPRRTTDDDAGARPAPATGTPTPPGPTWVPAEEAWNFVLHATHATAVTLLLYAADDAREPILALPLDPALHRTGDAWHCRIAASAIPGARLLGWRCDGPPAGPGQFHRYDREKILLDPFARAVHFPPGHDRAAAAAPGPNDGRAPLAILLPDETEPIDPGPEPRTPPGDLVIYELHVRGFTRHRSSGVAEARRGSYLGVIDRIPYLLDLGVNAVELMPVQQFDPAEGNYWGYMTLGFLAPHAGYASTGDPIDAIREYRMMVRALREAGISVLLDVVYNHTTEGGVDRPIYSWSGIDNARHYLASHDPARPYADFTGCGNTLDPTSPDVRRLVLESLRRWRRDLGADGFRFDLAAALCRRSDGALDHHRPPLIEAIGEDPVLRDALLIAEPWDAAGGHLTGTAFPEPRWMQWNDRFRDAIRRFLRGDPGLVAEVMTRVHGSTDLFPDVPPRHARPHHGVNYVVAHDGATLRDLFTYDRRYNHANGHDNHDGPNEVRWNCGHEGEDAPPRVRELRERQWRNALCLLLLSAGIPMIRMGDEFLQSQGGNTNPYNRDDETSWLDWSRRERHAGFHRFVRGMIAFRRAHPALRADRFWHDAISWRGVGDAPDLGPGSCHLGWVLRGGAFGDEDIHVLVNGEDRPLEFQVHAGSWRRAVDTARPSPDDLLEPGDEVPVEHRTLPLASRSIVVLVGRATG